MTAASFFHSHRTRLRPELARINDRTYAQKALVLNKAVTSEILIRKQCQYISMESQCGLGNPTYGAKTTLTYHNTAGKVTPSVNPSISLSKFPYSRPGETVGDFASRRVRAKRNPDRYRELGMPVVIVKYRRCSGKLREKLGTRLIELPSVRRTDNRPYSQGVGYITASSKKQIS